jgi:hypothetical protein
MTRMMITGIEITEGVSKKTQRAYAMGTLHTSTPLAAPFGEGNVAKGHAGDKFEADVGLLRKIEHLSFPCVADVEVQSVIRFGKREQVVTDIKPVDVVKRAA